MSKSKESSDESNSFVENPYVRKASTWLLNVFTSPTFVWFASMWVVSIITMVSFNLSRVGFNADGFTGGPAYYTDLFLHYGLNGSSTYVSGWESGFKAWIIAPFLAVWLGIPLFVIRDAGHAFNGRKEDPQGSIFYAFFAEYVYGFEVGLAGLKGNIFYIGIVWLPIIAASLITISYKRHVKRESSIVMRFSISFVISMWLSNIFARFSDPNFYYDWGGFWDSLITFRKRNLFVRSVNVDTGFDSQDFQGDYHPTSTGMLFALMHIIPIIVFGLMDAAGSVYSGLKRELTFYRERQRMLRERIRSGAKKLPWDVKEDTTEMSEEATK